ncbi:hypothetical protein CY34DRAFT_809664 [Suillus luteus UH-Slu-Lm8-n1]|uniref:Uncharacterized protein n=1 Tax=Suillus luteus UH-Slu-Lm8-n1 TaxID=930992 RepID=A0A0D0A8S4_9AGAM|nr:hypothetical protein CY34DRAFT_809664 [Suillus luteus UH-Slu-Lm8-n1]
MKRGGHCKGSNIKAKPTNEQWTNDLAAHHWVGKGKQLWRFSDGSDFRAAMAVRRETRRLTFENSPFFKFFAAKT